MKVFLDTSVVASAFVARGPCELLMRHILAVHEPFTSQDVLDELQWFLIDRVHLPPTTVQGIFALLWELPVMMRPPVPTPVRGADPDEEWVLAPAFLAEADVFLTLDKGLLKLNGKTRMRILDPQAFRRLVRKAA